jgi:hypothetical protein
MTDTELQPTPAVIDFNGDWERVHGALLNRARRSLYGIVLLAFTFSSFAQTSTGANSSPGESTSSGPSRLALAGSWERFIGGHYYDIVQVPSSYRSVGTATLRRNINVPRLNAHQRAILHFEGVAYVGKVSVNGKPVGEATWGRCEMDATSALVFGVNQIAVEIEDSQVSLGPNGAWEGYGGIIRDAYLDIHTDPYIENARLTSKIDFAANTAQLQLDVFLQGHSTGKAVLKASLSRDNDLSSASQEVTLTAGGSTVPLRWVLPHPALWSPDSPQLYHLKVELSSAAGTDVFTSSTGIREITIDGDKFFLNGQRLVVKGVARHDMWKDQGFTLTAAQIEQDMRMIKAMGANFVRLSAYPNDRRNVDAAERVGLLVSEESGLCWIDFRNAPRDTVEQGMRNLEGIIRRDWNSPSLFDVTFANESTPTVEVMQEARKRVKDQLSTLFISATSISSPDGTPEGVKRLYDDAGFDFYSTHPYGFDNGMTLYRKHLSNFSGKPVVFTEWGGRGVAQSSPFMHLAIQVLGRLVDEGKLAGLWFWSWQDVPEFSRDDVEMQDGFLLSGVVTEDRKVRLEVWGGLSELFQHYPRPTPKPNQQPQLVKFSWDAKRVENDYTPIAFQSLAESSGQQDAWQQLEKDIAEYWTKNSFTEEHWEDSGKHFWTWDAEELQTGPVPFRTAVVRGSTRPLVVTPGAAVEIDANATTASYLHFLGNATIPDGYPTCGKIGDVVGTIEVSYAKGVSKNIPLRWGMEVARANTVTIASRIDPVAVLAPKALEYVKDVRREVYQTLLFSVPVDPRPLEKIRIAMNRPSANIPISSTPNSTGSGYTAGATNLLVYAVTAERTRK